MTMIQENKWLMFAAGVAAGALAVYIAQQAWAGDRPTDEEMIAEYYRVETLVSVSPYDLKTALQRGEQDKHVVVDMRSPAEYAEGHITGAINIPNYLPSDATGESGEQRIVKAFRQVAAENPGKDIIVHCYSAACMVSRKVGNMLAGHGIYIKHLNIGWYEWKYYWTIWNGEDGNRAEDFITVGSEPGEPSVSGPIDPCGEGEFSC